MSQQANVVYVRPSSNGFAVAGFILALSGLFCCGAVLCPIGVVFSLIGLRKQPRGLAIAGLVIGALGTIWGIVQLVVFGVAGIVSCGGIVCGGIAPHVVTGARIEMLAREVRDFQRDNARLPASFDELPHVRKSELKDGWNHLMHLMVEDDGTFTIVSDGPDGQSETGDDIRKTRKPRHE